MARMTFALAADGLLMPALLGLDATTMQGLLAQGQPVPRPLQVRTQIDTGSIVTGVGPRVLNALGAKAGGSTLTQTASGLATVQFFRVSFTIFDPAGQSTTLVRTNWLVANLPQDLPDVDVLFGMDLVREMTLLVEGQTGLFTLDF